MCIQAQTPLLDSLKTAFEKAAHDTTRLFLLNELCENEPSDLLWPQYNERMQALAEKNLNSATGRVYNYCLKYLGRAINNKAYLFGEKGEYDKSIEYNHRALKIAQQLKDHVGVSSSLNNLGANYYFKGNIPKAMSYYEQSLNVRKKSGDTTDMFEPLFNIATIYQSQGNVELALETFHSLLSIAERKNVKAEVAATLNNIADIYYSQKDLDKAAEYFARTLRIYEELQNMNRIASALNNIGIIEEEKKNYKSAFDYYQRALKISQALNDMKSIAVAFNNLGSVMGHLKKEECFEYYKKALAISEKINDKATMCSSLSNLAGSYFATGNNSDAIVYGKRGLSVAMSVGSPERIEVCAEILKKIYLDLGNKKDALAMMELERQMHDSTHNISTRKALVKSQLKYEYEKRAAADSVAYAKESEVRNAVLRKQEAEIRSRQNMQYALYGGLTLVILFGGFMYNRYLLTQKQKSIIQRQKKMAEEQKLLIEQKQKEILDSIHYAKRIQSAHLPSAAFLKKHLEIKQV